MSSTQRHYQVYVYSKINPQIVSETHSFTSFFDATKFLESKVSEGYDCRYSTLGGNNNTQESQSTKENLLLG